MSNIPTVFSKDTSYENVIVECPWCDEEIIFNRASDLKTFEPIAGLDVVCLSADCGKPFRIKGDSVNNRHEMLIYDCYELMEQKHYMNSILTLCQAYEVFFSLYFRVTLLYKPFGDDPNHALKEMNRLSVELHKKIKLSFDQMRSMFLQHMVSGSSPRNLLEANDAIINLPTKPKLPKDADIEGISDTKLRNLLKAMKKTKINELRNKVVHKQAYRPTREETDNALKETRLILFPLTHHLQLYDDINWYWNKL